MRRNRLDGEDVPGFFAPDAQTELDRLAALAPGGEGRGQCAAAVHHEQVASVKELPKVIETRVGQRPR